MHSMGSSLAAALSWQLQHAAVWVKLCFMVIMESVCAAVMVGQPTDSGVLSLCARVVCRIGASLVCSLPCCFDLPLCTACGGTTWLLFSSGVEARRVWVKSGVAVPVLIGVAIIPCPWRGLRVPRCGLHIARAWLAWASMACGAVCSFVQPSVTAIVIQLVSSARYSEPVKRMHVCICQVIPGSCRNSIEAMSDQSCRR